MNFRKLTALSLATAAAFGGMLNAEESKPKFDLANSMKVKYNTLPVEAESFSEAFTKGKFYGRLRMNNFWWDWKEEIAGKQRDHQATGLGGSVIYKTARFANVGSSWGLFYTHGGLVNNVDADNVKYLKAGKDTTSRYNVSEDDDWDMAVLAIANIDVQVAKTNIKVGRQIFESVFTASNDTKMIPNTFEGVVVENKDIPATTLRLAHLTAQKLRDHETFHDVITSTDSDGNSWNGNDDSAKHKGLSYAAFKAAGEDTDHTLSIATAKSKIGNLKTELSYLILSDVLNDAVVEAHYAIDAGGTKIIPGFRYFKQMDNGGGKIGGASLKGDTQGYDDPNSLDSSLTAVRVDIQPSKAYKFRVGYSAIADEADLVTPWRGFPTGGFTRAMAQYNWYANTKTTMLRADVSLDKLGLLPDTWFLVRYAIQDFDDNKDAVQADSNILHTDWFHDIKMGEDLLKLKFRMGLVTAKDDIKKSDSTTKTDVSYNEYRFEINYLF